MVMMGKEGGEVLTLENLVTTLREVGSTKQAPPSDRYHLRPTIFGGNCDVEQFIKEFEGIMKSLQMEVVRLQQQRDSRRTLDVRNNSTRLNQLTCWGCGALGHVQRECPHKGRMPLSIRGSQQIPPTMRAGQAFS